MNLVGSKLGPYEIFALLGAGGMGEVYRAKDSRLKREVAIKILPPELLENRERQQRFEQEAQAASSLNHPNILVIHDIGVENGTHYMVSELVDGESLGKMIQKGPIAIKKLLDLAVQIADGLAAAHQAGIVHRDLKPENIMITPENRVKILDFGLAKLAPIGIEEHETLSHALSRSGIIRGTVPYMSPEQASSKTVDFRSDQFSLGLILYEMATGKRAFQQDTPVQVLSAIISEEPPPISTLNPKVPGPLRWLIERCMTKEPRQRYDSTADLHRELRGLSNHLSETGTSVEGGMTVPLRRPRWKQLAIAMTLVAAMCGVFIALLLARSPSEDLSSYSVTPLLTGVYPFSRPGWSPDGNTIAYVTLVDGVTQVFTKDLQSLISTQITNAKQNCVLPLWSADGTRVYYVSGGDLWLVSAAGGPSEKILGNVMSPVLSHKANALAFLRRKAGQNTLWISSPPGAEPRKYTLPSANAKEIIDRSISFSPDGSEIALWARTAEDTDFWIFPYPSGKLRSIRLPKEINKGASYSWMPDKKHIVFGGESPYNRKTHLRLIGINDGISKPLTAGYSAGENVPMVSPDGLRIAFSTVEGKGDLMEIPLDGSLSRHISSEGYAQFTPTWSPSGTQYAFAGENSGIYGIWLRSVSDHWTRPIVTTRELKADTFDSPSISPDGQRVAYQKDSGEIWLSPVSGGKPVRLVSPEWAADFPSWSPDGNWISFYEMRRKALAKVGVTGTGTPVILKEGIRHSPPRWSPKGDWITCITEEGLSLISPDGKTTQFLAKGNWGSHAWSNDGRTIYGLKFEGQRVWLDSVELGTGIEKRLNELERGSNTDYLGFSLSSDGSSVITSEVRVYATIWLLENFAQPTGFFARLRRKLNLNP